MTDRSDTDLLAQLRGLIAAGRAELVLDARRLDNLDSPVSVQAESTRWLYAFVAGIGAVLWWQGAAAAGVASALAVGLWYAWVRPDIARRIRGRVETTALYDTGLWRRLWRHGGVAIAEAGRPVCRSPEGNWMDFVRARCPRREGGEGT